jgi:arabinose-5-phosphate isomerase
MLMQDSMSAVSVDRLFMRARSVLMTEAAAISNLAHRLDESFAGVARTLLSTRGRVVTTGMGKSGHVAAKLAATLASTGTPAFFMHPAEAAHGDLGMIVAGDVLLALSNSGESGEILALLPALRLKGVTLIAMTGRTGSTMAQKSDFHLNVHVEREACPLGLAPTASTVAQMALGDALAMALSEARRFGAGDFALSHPGGSLGRRLLVRVSDVMQGGEHLPCVSSGCPLRDVLLVMSAKGLGMTAVVDSGGQLVGVFTDGDLRRALDSGANLAVTSVDSAMSRHPFTVLADQLAVDALCMMQEKGINGVLVLNGCGELVGALNMHGLLQAGIV